MHVARLYHYHIFRELHQHDVSLSTANNSPEPGDPLREHVGPPASSLASCSFALQRGFCKMRPRIQHPSRESLFWAHRNVQGPIGNGKSVWLHDARRTRCSPLPGRVLGPKCGIRAGASGLEVGFVRGGTGSHITPLLLIFHRTCLRRSRLFLLR